QHDDQLERRARLNLRLAIGVETVVRGRHAGSCYRELVSDALNEVSELPCAFSCDIAASAAVNSFCSAVRRSARRAVMRAIWSVMFDTCAVSCVCTAVKMPLDC